jgi:Leucine-rich repeat (LRR) protein
MNRSGYEQSFLERRKEPLSAILIEQSFLDRRKEFSSAISVEKSRRGYDQTATTATNSSSFKTVKFEDESQRLASASHEPVKYKKNALKTEENSGNQNASSAATPQQIALEEKEWNRIVAFRAEASSSRSRRVGEITILSKALRSRPTALEGTKLNLVSSCIGGIDGVPEAIGERVQTLYLGNNNISSIRGIEQFSNVQSISLTNNLIRYLSELRALGRLRHLEKLSLEGNVVTSMPFYRQYVLALCPRLRSLDGVKVSGEERAGARAASRKVSTLYQQLRLNQLQHCVLTHLRLQLALHSELSKVVLGRFR